jgi:choline kinase
MGRTRLHVIILAAGRGSRLGALAEDRSKWLLEVEGGTIAERQLAALRDPALSNGSSAVGTALVVTGHASDATERFLRSHGDACVRAVHNPDYATLNNWYSLLVGLREIPCADGDRVVVLNADLFAEPAWIASFLSDSARTGAEALIAVDLERALTDESMKVAAQGDLLERIGKVEVDEPVGEYVGMLMARGRALADLRRTLEGFVGRDDAIDRWYEAAVGITAQRGTPWTVWATPSSDWVEIDDDADYERARSLSCRS